MVLPADAGIEGFSEARDAGFSEVGEANAALSSFEEVNAGGLEAAATVSARSK